MTAARRLLTVADLAPSARSVELLGGELMDKAAPTGEHGGAQGALAGLLWPPFSRRPGGTDGPGGWWILTEVHVAFGTHDVLCPDLVGWRRETCPERPGGFPVQTRPDWICEVLSPSTARRDLGEKRILLQRAGVPWFWTVNVELELVQVYRWSPEGYLLSTSAGGKDRVALPPFEAVALELGRLFGHDD